MNNDLNKKDISIGPGEVKNDLYGKSGLILKDISEKVDFLKRTEKIVTAVYLVSGVLPETDPLRLSLRTNALDFLSFITSTFLHRPTQHIDMFDDIADTIVFKTENIISLLSISFFSGFVSEMNFSILRNELERFAGEIKQKKHPLIAGVAFGHDFFGSRSGEGEDILGYSDLQKDRGVIKDKISGTLHDKGHARTGTRPSPAKTYSKTAAKTLGRGAVDNSNEGSQNSPRKMARREHILDIVKKNGPLTIKDISRQVKECSEKTIQRELTSLIKDNIVQRSGERRWSMYALV